MNYKDYITPRFKKHIKKLRELTDEEHYILGRNKNIRSTFSTVTLIFIIFIPYIESLFFSLNYLDAPIAFLVMVFDMYSNIFSAVLVGGAAFLIVYLGRYFTDKDFFKRAKEINKKLK